MTVSEVTQILNRLELGKPSASEELLPLVYDELRRLAAQRLEHERAGQTLQATALVHEVYLRLVDTEHQQNWESRRHFFGAAAEAMRRILIESARRKQTVKRGGDWVRKELLPDDLATDGTSIDLIALDEALTKLESVDPQAASLVKLRYFSGLTIPQTAELLDVSQRTAERSWTFAKAWLFRELN